MSAPAAGRCTLIGASKLPPAAGDAESLCAMVERAITVTAPGVSYSAQIEIKSDSRMTAALVVNGRALPDEKFAVMDRTLNSHLIERFAQSIAATVAKAAAR